MASANPKKPATRNGEPPTASSRESKNMETAGNETASNATASKETSSNETVVPMKRVRARRGEGDRLRNEILDAAEKLLVETADAESVSIRAISQIVQVSAPSIYRHFEDKDALVMAVCERAYERFGEVLRAGAEAYPGPLGAIKGRALAYVHFALANPGHYRVLFMTPGNLVRVDHHHEHSFDVGQPGMKGLVELVAAVEQTITDGLVQPVASPLEMSLMLWAHVHGIASLRIAEPDMPWPPVEQQVDTMFMMLAQGMLTPLAHQRFAEFHATKP
jgi:AcrR family transcriptional regulator